VPELQGKPFGQTQREEVPRVWDNPGATGQGKQQTESLTVRRIVWHLVSIQHYRSHCNM